MAIVRRELSIVRRYPSWTFALMIWPILFPLAYLFSSRALAGPHGEGLVLFAQHAGTTNYAGFIVIGTVSWMWLNLTLWGLGTSLRTEQLRGTLESNWLTPTPRFALLLGVSAVQLITAARLLVISFLGFVLLLRVEFQINAAGALAVLGLSVPWVYGLGIAFAALVFRFKETNAFVFFVRGVFLIFAGISFPLSVLPGWMRGVAAWLPLTHTIGGLRRAMLVGASPAQLISELRFLAWSGALFLVAGFVCFQLVDRQVRRTGALGHH